MDQLGLWTEELQVQTEIEIQLDLIGPARDQNGRRIGGRGSRSFEIDDCIDRSVTAKLINLTTAYASTNVKIMSK